jgi:hypothetical protein
MLPMALAVAIAGACVVAPNLRPTQSESRVVMHKACAIGTVGKPDVDGTCEFEPLPGYQVVPGGVVNGEVILPRLGEVIFPSFGGGGTGRPLAAGQTRKPGFRVAG